MQDTFNKNRIVKNSLLLYVRMLFTMWLNLYATRLVLQNLGVEDMGVYAIVGSIVASVTSIGGNLTNAVQRFINFEMGVKGGNVNELFTSCINVMFFVVIFFLLLLETVGLWVLNTQVVIPPESVDAAFYAYQFSILSFMASILVIPYKSIIIANERMDIFAYTSVLQIALNCLAAYLISYVSNRLVVYSLLIMQVFILDSILSVYFCYRYYAKDVKYSWNIKWERIKDIGLYLSSMAVSSILYIVANQGIVFVINLTFGVALNAVYNISNQIKNSFMSFAANVNKAMAPQITQTYASKNYERHKKLVYTGCRINVFLLFFLLIPFLFKTEYILELWLKNVPQYTVYFARWIMLSVALECLMQTISGSVFATGNVKNYTIYPQLFYVIVLPLLIGVYHITSNPQALIGTIVCTDLLYKLLQIYYASKLDIIKIKEIVHQVLFRIIMVFVMDFIMSYFISTLVPDSIIGVIILVILNAIFLSVCIYIMGLNKIERTKICKFIKTRTIKSNL